MDSFTIKDLENLSGVKAHTIRIWEQRYAFLKPQRTDTNIRYYTNEELKKLLNVALLNKYGYKISHINRMTDEQLNERILSLTQTEAVQERIINDLVTCMVDINITLFEDLLDEYITARGIEKAIMQIIFPLLEKTGVLWLTNSIIPAQEHLVSNIIRQKFIAGIESTRSRMRLNKTALLFLPEDEHHEIGLLYMQYQFKSRGFNVLYIGADTPLTDVAYITERKKPDFIYTHIISSPSSIKKATFLIFISSNLFQKRWNMQVYCSRLALPLS
jgi:DNA-binding transcriptional MerR regulator